MVATRHNGRVDNLTHSLIGLAAGEALAQSTQGSSPGLPQPLRRNLLVAVAVIGSNLPDVDLAWVYARARDPLNYPLQHRGYTHTLIGVLLLALLLYGVVELWLRWRQWRPTLRDRGWLMTAALGGVLLHLGMDYFNSYGVHPFWPLDNHWYYGDSVFIVEPLYWLAAAPLLFVVRSRPVRWLLALATVIALAVAGYLRQFQPEWLVLVAATGLLLWMGRRCSPRVVAWGSLLAMLLVTGVFVFSGRLAAQRVARLAVREFPGEQVLDAVLTPLPTQPLCWDLLLIEIDGSRYYARHGLWSNAPSWLPAARCPQMLVPKASSAPLQPVSVPATAGLLWLGGLSLPQGQFAELADRYCDAYQLLQFVRAPYAVQRDELWTLGDLRFDRGSGPKLAQMTLSERRGAGPCRLRVPWIPPRVRLLRTEP